VGVGIRELILASLEEYPVKVGERGRPLKEVYEFVKEAHPDLIEETVRATLHRMVEDGYVRGRDHHTWAITHSGATLLRYARRFISGMVRDGETQHAQGRDNDDDVGKGQTGLEGRQEGPHQGRG